MDATVIGLAAGGLTLTTAGTVAAGVDVACRVKRFRDDAKAAEAERQRSQPAFEDNVGIATLAGRLPQVAAWRLERAEKLLRQADDRTARLAGGGAKLWRLVVSALVVLAGVLLNGAADILAASRTP